MGILKSAESFLSEMNRQKWTSDISCATRTVYLCGPFGGLCLVFDDQERTGLVVTLHTSEKCRSPFLYKHTHLKVKATNKLLNISSVMWKKLLLIELKLIVCDNMAKRQKSNSETLMKHKTIQEKTV